MTSSDAHTQAVAFLIQVGEYAQAELRQRWTLRTAPGNAPERSVELSDPAQVEQDAPALLRNATSQMPPARARSTLKLIEQRSRLIMQWQQMKLYHQEAYNLGKMGLAELRLNEQDLDEKIESALNQLENDLAGLGLAIAKTDA